MVHDCVESGREEETDGHAEGEDGAYQDIGVSGDGIARWDLLVEDVDGDAEKD